MGRGPHVVAENLLKELKNRPDIHFDIGFRENQNNNLIDIIWVVNDLEDLSWAIKNKERIGARKLWAGPNLVVIPQEKSGIIASDKIDKVIVPADWVREVYESECPRLIGKIHIWPVGTDTDLWAPKYKKKENREYNILVYNKGQDDLFMKIFPILELKGKINQISYGQYSQREYKRALNNSSFMVWLSQSESQGLALLEAFSMNVPVLAWDSREWKYYDINLNKNFKYPASSAPYFSPMCGMKFNSIEDFEEKLNEFVKAVSSGSFSPRKFLFDENLIIGETLRAFSLL
jgi:glycosyltransferase involved in cell wall biosynthesis